MDFAHIRAATYGDESSKPVGQARFQTTATAAQRPSLELDGADPQLYLSPDSNEGEPIVDAAEESEEVDTSTRPRLNPDQVSVLEQQFLYFHKPNSSIKQQLATQTGLSLPRVANWFQNRRAKAKQQKKLEQQMMQTVETAPSWNFEDSMSPGMYASPLEYHPSELASTPRQSTTATGFDAMAGEPNRSNQYDSAAEASFASLQRAITAAEAAQGSFNGGFEESKTELLTHDRNTFQPYSMSASSSTGGLLPDAAFSDWGSSRISSVVWTPACQPQLEDPFEMHNNTFRQPHLQQQSPIQQVRYDGFHNGTDLYSQPHITSYPSQLARQQPEMQQQLCLPEPSRQPPALPEDAISRRSSASSELANTLGTIDIHAHQPQPQHRGIVFKQPEIPPLDIAARRNRRRPAALGTAALRSRSCVGPLSMSPTAMGPFLGPSTSVRRIKSTGNNLNVARGRVQKAMPGSAQR
ncbi:MAG: hypothetical protein M1830_006429, partial [Pleopsidium flavum]